MALLHETYQQLTHWRYHVAVALRMRDPQRTLRPITDTTANYDRVGEIGRLREGAQWDPVTHSYRGGDPTPAYERLVELGEHARARFADGQDVVQNLVRLPASAAYVCGNRLLRGGAARAAAAELLQRQPARSRSGEGFEIAGPDLLYAQTGLAADRARLHHAGLEHLARALGDQLWGLAAEVSLREAAYLLFQAPTTKRGSDATIRALLVAVGEILLGTPPVLPEAIDLQAYVLDQAEFVATAW